MAGEAKGYEGIELFSASLPAGSPLSSEGWTLTSGEADAHAVVSLAGHALSKPWDLKGGRHCPAYARGFDARRQAWVERIYYAGAPENPWGPYAIGYLEWSGDEWVDQSSPVFVACEAWEHGSVYEPNVVYEDDKWRMWYVAGSNHEDYLVQGYTESEDGVHWGEPRIFAPADEKLFDFCILATDTGYEAIFSKVWLGKTPAPEATGLWWCRASTPSPNFSDWSSRTQIMTAAECGWHAGPWKPCFRYSERDAKKMFVFFDGGYRKAGDPGGFPYAFTLGCLEVDWLD